jgi:hypothetical protein
MGVARKALKTAAWVKAPKLMFARKHPRKAAVLAATSWLTGRLGSRRRQQTSFARTAVQGLGAAAIAIPVGIWVGRRSGDGPATH